MAKPEYKFKPYKPSKLKIKNLTGSETKKQITALQKQRDNLNKRLMAEGIDPDTLGGEFDNRNFLEKALNLKPDQGVLFDFFEVINRPVEAVKAGIMAGKEGRPILEEAWKGLSGQTLTPGGDVLDAFGVDIGDSPVAEFAEDVAADILLDPLNLIPSGFFLKRLGGLFTRSKEKLVKQFAGNVLENFSRITKLDGTQAAFNNLDELETFLRNASQDELVNIQKQIDNLTKKGNWKGDVFQKGSRLDGDAFDFDNSFEQLKQRAEKLQDYNSKIDAVEESFKRGDITLKQRAEKINEILPDNFTKVKVKKGGVEVQIKQIKESVVTEINLYDDAVATAKRYGSEYDALLNKTSNRVDDVTIVRKVKVGDKEYYFKALGLEAKNADGFFLKTATLAIGADGAVIIKETGGATTYSQSIKDRFNNIMNKQTRGRGRPTTVSEKIKKL